MLRNPNGLENEYIDKIESSTSGSYYEVMVYRSMDYWSGRIYGERQIKQKMDELGKWLYVY